MALISQQDQESLKKVFAEELPNDVTITYFTQRESVLFVPGQEKCAYCKETGELLEEVANLSEKLHLDVKDIADNKQEAQELGITRVPAFVLSGQAKGKVRYFGIPAGYEFSTLVESLLDVSRGKTELSEQTRKALAGVDSDLHIQVFVTPT
ncbi:MAG TPA: thioredoxin family protein [Ktedonobacteraceae bacterium]|jgi:glutaredoxin-like protein|nr:thioredoxin family protein [Ktedonobacteraceae bacterium]